MSEFSVNVDPARLRTFLTSPTGPIAAYLTELAVDVEAEAKTECPVDTGRLRSSIHHTQAHHGSDGELQVIVGTNVEYARAVHDGHWTKQAKRAGTRARVRRRIAGKPFLRNALRKVIHS